MGLATDCNWREIYGDFPDIRMPTSYRDARPYRSSGIYILRTKNIRSMAMQALHENSGAVAPDYWLPSKVAI